MRDNNQTFQDKSNQFEGELDNSFKKDHGIYYTDIKLSKDIVRFINIPQVCSAIDPCCGTGSFLYSLKEAGVIDIYGCDFDASTVKTCKEITQCDHVFCMDSIGPDPEQTLAAIQHEKFDYVVGNPPYAPISKNVELNTSNEFKKIVSRSGNNLYVAALYRAFGLAKEDGIISVIIPKNLLHIKTYSYIRKYLLENKSIISIVELGIHFKTVRGEQIILTLKNQKNKNNKILFYSYSCGAFAPLAQIPQSFYRDEIIAFTNNREATIYSKLTESYRPLSDAGICTIVRGRAKGDSIRGKQIRKYGIRGHELPKEGTQIFVQNIYTAEAGITAAFAGRLSAGETITVINVSSYEMSKYLLGLLHSRVSNYFLVRFAYNNSRLTMHADGKYLYTIPFVVNYQYFDAILKIVDELENSDYLSSSWFDANEKLNDIVYKIYDFSEEDVKYLESEMRTISSSKWYKDGLSHTVYY